MLGMNGGLALFMSMTLVSRTNLDVETHCFSLVDWCSNRPVFKWR